MILTKEQFKLNICLLRLADSFSVTNDKGQTFGTYCGEWTGKEILVTGDFVLMTFISDEYGQERGFEIYFTAVPLGKA